MSQSDPTSTSISTSTTTKPVWCPERQIYLGGVIPGASNADLQRLLADNQGALRVFGYGSLCWNPGPPDTALGNPAVTATLGHAHHYRRVWGQKSTDHRGTPLWPGVVCTLLQTSEVKAILQQQDSSTNTTTETTEEEEEEDLFVTTEGMIYLVPPRLAQTCLTELDFREKGGYAREIINVVEDASGKSVQALLYRGTPDNPAFSARLVRDLPLAAATMAVSVGPSGPNDVYLNQLNEFLVVAQQQQQQQQHQSQKQKQSSSSDIILHDDTCTLANMTRQLQQPNHGLYFFYGCGSNQHGQIINYNYNYKHNSALQLGDKDQDFQQLTESVVFCQYPTTANTHKATNDNNYAIDPPKEIVAGGGHSGLLTESGHLFLWGWNDSEQCASASPPDAANTNHDNDVHHAEKSPPLPLLRPLPNNLRVEQVAFGFSHTVVIEKETGRLYAFGDNSHGQVTGAAPPTAGSISNSTNLIATPTMPQVVGDTDQFVAIAAGVFHTAAITAQGELVTFGSGKHGQSLPINTNSNRWKPPDQSRLVQVVCGRYHTAVLDDQGRIWTMGDNKYGQLGRDIVLTNDNNHNVQQSTSSSTKQTKPPSFDPIPQLVDGPLGKHSCQQSSNRYRCVQLESGWSHIVARVETLSDNGEIIPELYGWGRSDKGQLACHDKMVPRPRRIIFQDSEDQISSNNVCQVSCGSESTYILVENKMTSTFSIHSCGWNEHGNLGVLLGAMHEIGNSLEDVHQLTRLPGASRIVSPPTYRKNRRLLMAAGGAHFITIMT